MAIGLVDEAAFFDNPADTFPLLAQTRTQVVRVNLYWGGRVGVARSRPDNPADPDDPAYNGELYDRTVKYAAQYRIWILFSIFGTPGWANGGKGLNRAPTRPRDLELFAFAAAKRYSGTWLATDGRKLPPVRLWLAWNEPNYPIGLMPQYRRVRGKWVVQSAIDYARICTAVYNGVHRTLLRNQKVACGATGPRGNNLPTAGRQAKISPLAFARLLHRAGLRRFDAYAHHPYYGKRSEAPTTKPGPSAITLANIGVLLKEISRLWGPRKLWITEYGYQTNPPDRTFGVSYARQARYLKQAFSIARRNPRIDMMLWFLLRDEPRLSGWQSGLLTRTGKRKPSFYAFRSLPR